MLDRIRDLIQGAPQQTGLLPDDPAWIASLPRHELFGSADQRDDAPLGASQPDWRALAPEFRWQQTSMMCTAFAAANAMAMLEARETGRRVRFSQCDIYRRANGETYGNTVQNTAEAMKAGALLEEACPWPGGVVLDAWNPCILTLFRAYAAACAAGREASMAQYAAGGVTSVVPSRDAMRRALMDSPLLAVVNVGRGWYDRVAPRVEHGSAHLVALTKVFDDGRLEVRDSLKNSEAPTDGFRTLASDFDVLFAFGVTDLPNDWMARQEAATRAGRYGKPASPQAEQRAGWALQEAERRNPTHAMLLARDHRLYVMATAYGGYSVQDVLNHITSVRRTGRGIFDFSRPRAI